MSKAKAKPKGKPRRKPGRPPVHGAFSLLASPGTQPKSREITDFLRATRESLIVDLSPEGEKGLTTGQGILLNRLIAKVAVTRVIEEYIRKSSVMTPEGVLKPVLTKNYLQYCHSIRADLVALEALSPGDVRQGDVLTPFELAKVIDAENARKAKRKKGKKAKASKPF